LVWNRDALEGNEWEFCKLWTDYKIVADCSRVLLNPKLADDYFFNRAEVDQCTDLKLAVDAVSKVFAIEGVAGHIYDGKVLMADSRLTEVDTIYTLVYAGSSPRLYPSVEVKYTDPESWTDTFCHAFEVPGWREEVYRITSSSSFAGTLIEATDELGPIACCALFHSFGVTGIYCLGTIPTRRGRGVATSMLTRIVPEQENPFLQSLRSEQSLGFYERIGFVICYQKKIYRL
jgi:GNAT superfamily N-acetyltransferase